MTTLLDVVDLHARYGDSHVLRGVGLQIKSGRSLGLLGRNGMGKTTLIRTALGYVRASGGSVAWQGRAVTGAAPEKMARLGIGYVPEGRGIFPNLSVRENLVMCARAGADGRRDWTLERVLATFPRLTERLEHGGQQLSGGEQQMLAIGRALLTNPLLLILDEATEGLAPLVREEIWRALRQLRTAGLAMVVIDKYVQRLVAIGDHHVIVEKGRVAWRGSSQALGADRALWHRHLGA